MGPKINPRETDMPSKPKPFPRSSGGKASVTTAGPHEMDGCTDGLQYSKGDQLTDAVSQRTSC
ncbi:unnamed protein product [marine sediment metagenome]|uniref:Uncharacterized protein n=1 Tax=marine sediment metagenome TaxID=412755 RepID=X0UWE4_9ZZZZ